MPDPKNPLDLVKGGPTDTMIAEFPGTVGSMRFSEPAPLAPGYQGGLWKAGGEGSRGGHIVGHTGSGKPIYMNPSKKLGGSSPRLHGHDDWKADDHTSAAKRLLNHALDYHADRDDAYAAAHAHLQEAGIKRGDGHQAADVQAHETLAAHHETHAQEGAKRAPGSRYHRHHTEEAKYSREDARRARSRPSTAYSKKG